MKGVGPVVGAGVTGPAPKPDEEKANDLIKQILNLEIDAKSQGLIKTAETLHTAAQGLAYEATDVIKHKRTGVPVNDIYED